MVGKETTGRLPKARMGRKKRAVCQASGTGAGGQRGNQHAARLAWAARAVKCGGSAGGRVPGPAGSEAIGTWHGWVELPGSQNMGGLSGAWRRFRQRGNRHAARLVWAVLTAKCGWSVKRRAPEPAGDDAINMRRGWFGCPGRKTRTIYRVAGGLPGAGRWGWQPAGSGVISARGAAGLGLSWPQKRGRNPGACGIPGFRLFFTPV